MKPVECKKCRVAMSRVGALPAKPGYDRHTYRCETCGSELRVIMDTRFTPPAD